MDLFEHNYEADTSLDAWIREACARVCVYMRVRVCNGDCVYEVPSQMASVNCTVLTRTAD